MGLSDDDIASMTTSAWDAAKAALRAGDAEGAERWIDTAMARTRSLQVYSVNWITSLLSFVGRELGEDGVERALRATGEEFVRPRRGDPGAWDALPAEARAKVVARAMVANGGDCDVAEDDEKIVLSFRCGSGGMLIDDGRYDVDGGPYLTLRERGGRTFGRDALPVYCAHCSVHNEIQPVEWGGGPTSVEFPPEHAGERCVHHVYKDPHALPDEAYIRIGVARP
jgi:hypothetical protein